MIKYKIGDRIKLNPETTFTYDELRREQERTGYLRVSAISNGCVTTFAMCEECLNCTKISYQFVNIYDRWWCQIETNSEDYTLRKPKTFKQYKNEQSQKQTTSTTLSTNTM